VVDLEESIHSALELKCNNNNNISNNDNSSNNNNSNNNNRENVYIVDER